jgi:ceramide synthetase
MWEYYLLFVRTPDDKLPAVWTQPEKAFLDIETQEQAPELWGLYITHLALWTYLGILHIYFEPRRKDFVPMLLHHVVTLILISGAIYTNGFRGGLLVLFVNDFPDIFVDLLKMANYLKLRGPKALYIAETAFVLMMLVFAVFRLYIMPFKVNVDCGVVMFNSLKTPTDGEHWYDFPWTLVRYPLYAPLNSLLWVLTGLNIWWFWLMVRIVLRIVNDGADAASRDEYEGGSEDEDEDKAPEAGFVILGTIRALWRVACGPRPSTSAAD